VIEQRAGVKRKRQIAEAHCVATSNTETAAFVKKKKAATKPRVQKKRRLYP